MCMCVLVQWEGLCVNDKPLVVAVSVALLLCLFESSGLVVCCGRIRECNTAAGLSTPVRQRLLSDAVRCGVLMVCFATGSVWVLALSLSGTLCALGVFAWCALEGSVCLSLSCSVRPSVWSWLS